MSGLLANEDCPASENEHGTHCEHWYEDEGCHSCGTQEPNLVILPGPGHCDGRGLGSVHCFHPRQLHTVEGFIKHYDWCCKCSRTPYQIEEEA